MTAPVKPLSQRLGDRLYYYGTLKPADSCGIERDEVKEVLHLEETIKGLKIDLAAREAERDKLKEKLRTIEVEYTGNCAECQQAGNYAEQVNRAEVAESALREAQTQVKEMPIWDDEQFRTGPYGVFNTISWDKKRYFETLNKWRNELEKAISISCTKADATDDSWKTGDKGPSPVCKYCEHDSDCYSRFFNPDGSMKPGHPEYKADAGGETPK